MQGWKVSPSFPPYRWFPPNITPRTKLHFCSRTFFAVAFHLLFTNSYEGVKRKIPSLPILVFSPVFTRFRGFLHLPLTPCAPFTNGYQRHAASQVQHFPDAAASLRVSGTALSLTHSVNGHAALDWRLKDESTGQSVRLCIRAYSSVAAQPSTAQLQRQTKSPVPWVTVVSTLLSGCHYSLCCAVFFSECSETSCGHICSR